MSMSSSNVSSRRVECFRFLEEVEEELEYVYRLLPVDEKIRDH
jgi:hypothetical protein